MNHNIFCPENALAIFDMVETSSWNHQIKEFFTHQLYMAELYQHMYHIQVTTQSHAPFIYPCYYYHGLPIRGSIHACSYKKPGFSFLISTHSP